jgi:homoserine kinase
VLPADAPLEALVETVGNAATLVAGMCRDDPDLVGAGMRDSVVTPARAALVEGYDAACTAARDVGATGVTISGSGPGVLAVCRPDTRRVVASAMLDAFDGQGVDARAYQTRVGDGAEIL